MPGCSVVEGAALSLLKAVEQSGPGTTDHLFASVSKAARLEEPYSELPPPAPIYWP